MDNSDRGANCATSTHHLSQRLAASLGSAGRPARGAAIGARSGASIDTEGLVRACRRPRAHLFTNWNPGHYLRVEPAESAACRPKSRRAPRLQPVQAG